ncbi:MAG: hypothetical protein AB7V40_04940 [Methyloceanibacter sp.]
MLRPLMIASGAFEALFGLSALIAPDMLIGALGAGPDVASIFLARILGAATLGLGVAALLARDHLASKGGLAAAYGLGLYNVLAAAFILWTARDIGGAALWSTGLIHAAIGALFVYALARARG